MSSQPDLFKKDIRQIEEEKYTKEYCLNYLRTSSDIWDMRTWHKDHDRKEVEAWIKDPDIKNDGHAGFCIKKLQDMGDYTKRTVLDSMIVDAIMANNKISYANRIVPCFLEECPKWVKNGRSYAGDICHGCESVRIGNKRKKDANKKSTRTKNTDKA